MGEGGDKNFPPYVAVVQARGKLIRYLDTRIGEEFYDLARDPDELTNRIADPAEKDRIQVLRAALKDELARTEAPFPP